METEWWFQAILLSCKIIEWGIIIQHNMPIILYTYSVDVYKQSYAF